MKRCAALLFSFCLAPLAWADLTMVQRVEGSGMEGEMTVRIKGTKVRADVAQPVSTVADSATGETLVLQHRPRTFNRITAEQTKALAEQVLKAQGAAEPAKLTPTGEKKEILGHQTQGFLWTVGKVKIKFWVCTDFPDGAAVQRELDALQSSGLATAAANMMPTAAQLPGLRLRTELEMGGQKVVTTLQSVKHDKLDDAIFQPPPGYKEVALPVTGAGQTP